MTSKLLEKKAQVNQAMNIMDFSRHNEEVQQVWEAYRAGKPVRTPMVLATNPRIWIQDPRAQPEGRHLEGILHRP